MIETYDVGRKSDVILHSLNGLYDRKMAGALADNEFCDVIINTCDLVANNIRQGKRSKDEIESIENHLTHLLDENCDKYYNYPHKDLQRAGKTALESIDFATDAIKQRLSDAQPVMDAESYTKTFKKLGN